MAGGQPIVRRARKSLRERRMKQCMNELTTNLDKVELTVHKHNRNKRFVKRTKRGQTLDPIPATVRQGIMTDDLFEIECQLHKQAGLPAPRLPKELGGKTPREERRAAAASDAIGQATISHRFGLIQFSDLVSFVKSRRALKV